MSSQPVLVFDVNETLLDLNSLIPHFERMFGDPRTMREWFAQVILYSGALSLTQDYVNFGDLGGSVLRMLAATRNIEVSARPSAVALPPSCMPCLGYYGRHGRRLGGGIYSPRG